MHVDYKMNYLTKLQTVELEKAGLHYCIAMCSIYLADRKLNKHTLFNQNGSAPLSWTTEDCIEGVNVFINIIYLDKFQNLLKERNTFFVKRPYDWRVL